MVASTVCYRQSECPSKRQQRDVTFDQGLTCGGVQMIIGMGPTITSTEMVGSMCCRVAGNFI